MRTFWEEVFWQLGHTDNFKVFCKESGLKIRKEKKQLSEAKDD